MNISVEHIAIPAADPAALKRWYERVLGAKAVWDNGQNPPTCLLSLANVWFEIYQADVSLAERRSFSIQASPYLRATSAM